MIERDRCTGQPRCRTLYEKFLEFNPENVQTWMKFVELDTLLGDANRGPGRDGQGKRAVQAAAGEDVTRQSLAFSVAVREANDYEETFAAGGLDRL